MSQDYNTALRRSPATGAERLPVECRQPIQTGFERDFDFLAKYAIRGIIGGGSAEGGAVATATSGFSRLSVTAAIMTQMPAFADEKVLGRLARYESGLDSA